MTSAPTPAESASPTAFTTRLTTAAPSASASRTTHRLSPPIPSPPGGNARDRVAMAMLPSSSFWRTQVAATIAVPGPGRLKFRLSYAIHLVSRLRSLTILPAHPNGTPSNTGCSLRFPNTGPPNRWSAMKRCWALFAIPAPRPAWLSRHTWIEKTILPGLNWIDDSFHHSLLSLAKYYQDGTTLLRPICEVIFAVTLRYPDGPNGGELLRLLHSITGKPLSPK